MGQHNPNQAIEIGVARADITPPVGIRSSGFAGRGPLTAHHDPLYATVLVISDGSRQGAIVSCDLLGLDDVTVAQIRETTAARTGLDPAWITIACTHTHYGPDAYRDQDADDVRAYRENLTYVIAGAIQEAASRLTPAQIGIGRGASDIGINRREKLPDGRIILGQNPGGPIDRSLAVVRVDAVDGTPLACLVNFQTHPVSQGSQTSHISADYVGRARQVIEDLTGVTCLYLQGAAANINAVIMAPGYEPARTLGTRLGCEIARVWETISPHPIVGLRMESEVADLPGLSYGSMEKARQLVGELTQILEKGRAEGASDGAIWWLEHRLTRAREALQSWESGTALPPVKAELQAWQIGDLALATVPGEIFCQIGQRIKDGSPFENTLFAGYTNGSIGYVPVPEAYPEGGYEVQFASRVDPGAAACIIDGCLALLQRLATILEGTM